MLININRCTPPREHNILLGLFVLQIKFLSLCTLLQRCLCHLKDSCLLFNCLYTLADVFYWRASVHSSSRPTHSRIFNNVLSPSKANKSHAVNRLFHSVQSKFVVWIAEESKWLFFTKWRLQTSFSFACYGKDILLFWDCKAVRCQSDVLSHGSSEAWWL